MKKKRRRRIVRWIILLIILIAAAGVYTAYRLHPELFPMIGTAGGENAEQEITKEAAYFGTITVTTEGNGIIEPADTETVVSDYTVEIASVEVEAGDTVAAGDLIAKINLDSVGDRIDETKAEISDLNSQIRSMDRSGSSSVTAPVSGRVKRIFVQEGDLLSDVVYRFGGIMELSADRKLKVTFRSDKNLVPGMEVDVALPDEEETADGTVASADAGLVTVTISDASDRDVDTAVRVLDENGALLGEGVLLSNSPYLVDARYGTCDDINVDVGDYIDSGATLLYREDYNYNADYTDAVNKRDEKIQLLQDLQKLEENPVILAESDGIVSDLMLSDRQVIGENAPMYTLISTDTYRLKAQIDELDIAGVEPGQPVSITYDAFDEETWPGTVEKVSALGTNTGGVTTYTVSILMDGVEKVKLGMSATATITVEEKEHALLVPVDAVQTVDGEKQVTVISGEDVTETPVEVGLVNNTVAEITEGLSEGQEVVVYDNSGAADWITQMMQRRQDARERRQGQ